MCVCCSPGPRVVAKAVLSGHIVNTTQFMSRLEYPRRCPAPWSVPADGGVCMRVHAKVWRVFVGQSGATELRASVAVCASAQSFTVLYRRIPFGCQGQAPWGSPGQTLLHARCACASACPHVHMHPLGWAFLCTSIFGLIGPKGFPSPLSWSLVDSACVGVHVGVGGPHIVFALLQTVIGTN